MYSNIVIEIFNVLPPVLTFFYQYKILYNNWLKSTSESYMNRGKIHA